MDSTASIVRLLSSKQIAYQIKTDVLLKRSHPWKIDQILSATTPLQIG